MSTFLKEQAGHDLNYESREMACHFADAYCQRLKGMFGFFFLF